MCKEGFDNKRNWRFPRLLISNNKQLALKCLCHGMVLAYILAAINHWYLSGVYLITYICVWYIIMIQLLSLSSSTCCRRKRYRLEKRIRSTDHRDYVLLRYTARQIPVQVDTFGEGVTSRALQVILPTIIHYYFRNMCTVMVYQ